MWVAIKHQHTVHSVEARRNIRDAKANFNRRGCPLWVKLQTSAIVHGMELNYPALCVQCDS
jgi:ribosomal protein L39E